MRDQCLRKNEVGDARKEQHQTIERDRPSRVVILVDPSDRERLKRLRRRAQASRRSPTSRASQSPPGE